MLSYDPYMNANMNTFPQNQNAPDLSVSDKLAKSIAQQESGFLDSLAASESGVNVDLESASYWVKNLSSTSNLVKHGAAYQLYIQGKSADGETSAAEYLYLKSPSNYSQTAPIRRDVQESMVTLDQLDDEGKLYKLPAESITAQSAIDDAIKGNQALGQDFLEHITSAFEGAAAAYDVVPENLDLDNVIVSRITGEIKALPTVRFIKAPKDVTAYMYGINELLIEQANARAEKMKKKPPFKTKKSAIEMMKALGSAASQDTDQ